MVGVVKPGARAMRDRHSSSSALFFSLILLVVAAGCPADDAAPGVTFDPGGGFVPADTTQDDTGPPVDVAADTSPDVTVDVGADIAPDAALDVAPDTGPDAGCESDPECEGLVATGTCQVPRCMEGTCVAGPADDGATCDDGDACTEHDACTAGACAGEPLPCDDGNLCTTDSCAGGTCAHADNSEPCDDGNPCTTVDTCDAGTCVGVGNGCVCVGDGDCAQFEDTDPCTGALVCSDGLCAPDAATIPDCAAEVGPCGVGTCEAGVGCVATLLPDGAICDDGDGCTSGETCDAGVCVPAATIPCDDGEPCTDDVCTVAGVCTHPPAEGPCDDGDGCTVDDQCGGGKCKAGPKKDCDDGTICTDDGCAQGKCVHVPTWEQPCEDGDACTSGDTCKDGACLAGGPVPCDDANPCTDDSCDPMTGCVNTPSDGPCDDGDPCTHGETCVAGACVAADTVDCDDGEPCTTDVCLPDGGCDNLPADGAPCDDGDPCTGGDACAADVCEAGPFDLCGACQGQPDLSACDDGAEGTGPDVCLTGACVGFTRALWLPTTTPKTTAAAFVDVTASEGVPMAAGWRVDAFGATTTYVAALAAGKDPAVMTGSVRSDSVYRAIRHRVVVGTAGRVGFLTGTTWDGASGLWSALKTVSGLSDLTDVWGTTLMGAPGAATPTEQWLVAGLNKNGTSPFVTRCAREANPAGGFKWYCEDLSALPVSGIGPGGVWGMPGSCDMDGCTPASVVKHVLLGNKLPGDADNLIFESDAGVAAPWSLAANLDGTPGDQLLSVDGASLDTVWAVGTHGLWAHRTAGDWVLGAKLDAPGAAVDLESVHVAGGRVWAVGTRHTYAATLDRAELILLVASATDGALSQDQMVVLSTHECLGDACVAGEDVHGNNGLTGAWAHDGVLWIVGREWSDGAQRTVVYSAPIP